MTRSLLLLIFLLSFVVEVSAQTPNRGAEGCNWHSKTPPDALNGNQGSPSSHKYWFGHIADVDTENNKHRFIYQIKNLHTDRPLPVEWLLGDGTPQIAFTRIFPGDCGTSTFETYSLFKEDPKATLKYGPLVQERKMASLYTPDQSEARKDGPPLKSTLIADVQDREGKRRTISIEMTTEYSERTFVHTIRNFGSSDEVLRIQALSAFRQNNPNLMAITQWPMDGDLAFVENNERPYSFSFTINENATIQEKLIAVQVVSRNLLSGETEILATASFVLYLPITDN